jgi:hypothetical protein
VTADAGNTVTGEKGTDLKKLRLHQLTKYETLKVNKPKPEGKAEGGAVHFTLTH